MSETMKNLKNFSVLVPNTGANQISFCLINQVNRLFDMHPEIDVMVFYENMHQNCVPSNFAAMEISQAFNHKGPMIATTISTAEKLISFPSEKKFFYVWDLSWVRNSRRLNEYEKYNKVYSDKSLELIARSQSHKKAIQNCFNREVNHVISDFKIEEILEIL